MSYYQTFHLVYVYYVHNCMIILFRTTDLSDVNNVQRIKEVLKTAPSRNIVLLSSRNPSYVIDVLNDTFTRVGFKLLLLHYSHLLKRLYLVKTTSWQHRFFDLANLSPKWLGTYEYMKNTLQNFFFSV